MSIESVKSIPKRQVLSLHYHDLSVEHAAEYILSCAEKKQPLAVFTPGATVAAQAEREEYRELLSHADLTLADGVGILLAARLCGEQLSYLCPGISVGEELLRRAAEKEMKVFFYGAAPGVALRAAKKICEKYPTLRIATADGYGEDPIDGVLRFSPDLVFVCLGFPRQEKWIDAHAAACACPCLGLGGSFDVWSERLRRAPRVFRMLGLEWLYRTLREPRRAVKLLPLPRYFLRSAGVGAKKLLHNFQKAVQNDTTCGKM